jgi:hypothetical protein
VRFVEALRHPMDDVFEEHTLHGKSLTSGANVKIRYG